MQNLKYLGYTVAFQEVPNEVSLIINISGCPHHCGGCHSPQLWEYKGEFIKKDLQSLIDRYPKMITCVCFMGGDQNINELNELLRQVKNNGLKTCVYSGSDNINIFDLSLLNYLKIGHFDILKGGLDEDITNQVFYEIELDNLINRTYLFKKQNRKKLD